jgi:hypothetical protein
MVKNEADIIEASIRHNLHYVDLMAVIDNGSSDGTRQILEKLREEGLPLVLFDDPSFGHFQSEKVTEVYRRVVSIYQPQLVFLLDADEFIRATDRQSLESVLSRLQPGEQGLLPWLTHIPEPRATLEQLLADPLGSAPWRRRQEDPLYYKAVIRRRSEDDLDIVIEQGNHRVRMKSGRAMPSAIVQGAYVAHLPVRSVSQVSAKAINGWQACVVRNRTRNVPGEAYQWQALYERLTSGQTLSPSDISEVALGYAQNIRLGRTLQADAELDPTPALYGRLKYVSLGRHDPLAKVALSMSQFIESEAPQPPRETGVGLDVAAVASTLRRGDLTTLAILQGNPGWFEELAHLMPGLQEQPLEHASLLLAPNLDPVDRNALFAALRSAGTRQVVTWLKECHSSDEVGLVIEAACEAGWDVDLMLTLSLRAIASYSVVRRGGFVLRKADRTDPSRAHAVRAALKAMAAQPMNWTDPPPQVIQHSLQTLTLKEVSRTPVTLDAAVRRPHLGRLKKMRVAIITPYYKEPRAWLERCLASVQSQDHACEHFVISDGHAQDWLDHMNVRHIRLDMPHADYGNTPRSIGAQLAVAEGFEAVAFLDADNWYEPHHVSACVDIALSSGADYVVSGRRLNREDGSVLPWRSREDELVEHVDTSCFFMLEGAFHALPRWLLMPKPMTMLGDRYFLLSLRKEGLREARTSLRTVNYLCGWADVYRAVGEVPPSFAKEALPLHQVRQWLRRLAEKDQQLVERLTGCDIALASAALTKMGA